MKQPVERRLAAILAADVAGYSRLMGADEEGTHERLTAHFRELVDPKIKEHRGRTVKNTGDGLLAEFPSVVDAVRCAVEIQQEMAEREPAVPDARRVRFRAGGDLHITDSARSHPRQATLPIRRYGRADLQEHRAARAGLCFASRRHIR